MALTHTSSALRLLLFSYFAVFLAVYLNSALVHGRAKDTNSYQLVDVDSLLPKPYCTTNNRDPAVGSSKLKVTYKYGPCAPIGHGKEIPSSEQILLHDEARNKFMNDRISKQYPTEDSNSQLLTTFYEEGGVYIVTIKMGTPQQDYLVSIDTGSDITWLQCQPCFTGCHSNPKLRFDSSKSSTYVNGSCKSNEGNNYEIHYYDESYSRGQWGCDTLTLESSDVTPNFQFGCGQNISGFGSAVEVGMLGLGRGPTSLLSQTASQYGKTFVYCFPGPISSTGYLLFGDKAKSSSSAFKFTPLLKGPDGDSSFYFLELVAISVGGTKLKISPSVFRSRGTLIDSGTVITRLPASAYSVLKSAFKKSMSKYPSAPATGLLDTCYNLERYENEKVRVLIPTIVFHFGGGADVTLDPSGTVWTQSSKQVCLGFAPTLKNYSTIIGSNQQHALKVFYDTEGGRIGFGNTDAGRCLT